VRVISTSTYSRHKKQVFFCGKFEEAFSVGLKNLKSGQSGVNAETAWWSRLSFVHRGVFFSLLLARPGTWNLLQVRHRTAQGRQSAGTLPLDEGLESFPKQCRFFRHPGELLGSAHEIVIQRNRGSHRGSIDGAWQRGMLIVVLLVFEREDTHLGVGTSRNRFSIRKPTLKKR
jgi:hypothetical protein